MPYDYGVLYRVLYLSRSRCTERSRVCRTTIVYYIVYYIYLGAGVRKGAGYAVRLWCTISCTISI